jgi:hypothetical protein
MIYSKSNKTGVNSGAETTYHPEAPEFTPGVKLRLMVITYYSAISIYVNIL